MFRSGLFVTTLVVGSAHASVAQKIPATVAAAEVEGASYTRGTTPPTVSWAFRDPSGGTAERKCVAVVPDYSTPGGSLRSGEFIMRSGLVSQLRPLAGRQYKVLWLPLHSARDIRQTMLLRGTRIGHPADSIRIRVAGATAAGRPRSESGFPSIISFPAAGQWIVVATAGTDWGCFLISISSVEYDGFSIGPPWRTP